jgi:hypothetical protein
VAAGVRVYRVCVVVSALSALVSGCTSKSTPPRIRSARPTPTSATQGASSTRFAAASDRVVVGGDATVDGARFSAPWIGAVVLHAGLDTPCQDALGPVRNGYYSIVVLADTDSSGCGQAGARIVLWTFLHHKFLYSTNVLAWPTRIRTASFTPRFSSSDPAGAAPVTAEFTGTVRRRDGAELPPGTRIDAFVLGTHCGTASIRSTSSFTGYILAVVGPDSIPGCARGAAVTIRVDGRSAAHSRVVNTPPGQREALDLTVP